MEWLKTIASWGTAPLQYAGRTIQKTAVVISTFHKPILAMRQDKSTKGIFSDFIKVLKYDGIPYVLTQQAMILLATYLVAETSQQDDQLTDADEGGLSMLLPSLCFAALWAAHKGLSIYSIRKTGELKLASTLLLTRAPGSLTKTVQPEMLRQYQENLANAMFSQQLRFQQRLGESNLTPPNCRGADCKVGNFLVGSIVDTAVYLGTVNSLSFLSLFSYSIGTDWLGVPWVIQWLSCSLDGRLILASVTRLCNLHGLAYLNKHSEWALALGLVHQLLTFFISQGIESLTGIDADCYMAIINLLTLLFMMSVAAHIVFPRPAVTDDSRMQHDVVACYQTFLHKMIHIIGIMIAENIVPFFAQEKKTPIVELLKQGVDLWGNPRLYYLKKAIVPSLFWSKEAAVQHYLLKEKWEEFRLALLSIIDIMLDWLTYRFAGLVPLQSLADTLIGRVAVHLLGKKYGIRRGATKHISETIASRALYDVLLLLSSWLRTELIETRPPCNYPDSIKPSERAAIGTIEDGAAKRLPELPKPCPSDMPNTSVVKVIKKRNVSEGTTPSAVRTLCAQRFHRNPDDDQFRKRISTRVGSDAQAKQSSDESHAIVRRQFG